MSAGADQSAVTPRLSDDAIDQLFARARSFNSYTDEPFGQEDARALAKLVADGPTSANQQPARFVWCLSAASRERLAACAAEGNRDKITAAPAAVVIGMDLEFHEHLPWLFPHADAKSWFGEEAGRHASAFRNSTLQGAYLILAARALGWDTGPMSGFDPDAVDVAFFADQPAVRVNFIATLGRGDRSTLFPRSPRPEFERFNSIA